MSELTQEDRERIVAEARSWLGTPFKHQGRLKGVGVDCAGVAVGTAQACGMEFVDVKGYARLPAKGQFSIAVRSATDEISLDDLQPGDLMTFVWREEPQHIAICVEVTPMIRMIHAWQEVRKCVENDFDSLWRSRLVECRRYRKAA